MKIDGSQMADDLLQRMQEAHEQQGAGAVDETTAGTDKTFRVDELQGPRETDSVQKTERSDLELRLEETAQKALRGEFDDAASVRSEVVDHILRDRWESRVGKAKMSRMLRTVKPTLVADPEFTRQVDEMLIMAARQLGSPK
jgi:hypothetical protein